MPRSHAFSLFHHFLGMGCGEAGIISSVISIEYYMLLYRSVQLEGCCLFKSIIFAVNVILGDYQFGITQSQSFQIHWWPCKQDLAKHSLLLVLCMTTSDGFLKVMCVAVTVYPQIL